MHHYDFHIKDYNADTAHLSNDEDLCFRRLLDMYYDTESPIPKETEWVSRRLRVKTESVIAVLKDFFVEAEDGWHHARCDHEIAVYQARAETARSNGKAGGRPKKTQRDIYGNRKITGLKANHEPVTSNHEPVTSNQKTKTTPAPVGAPASGDAEFVEGLNLPAWERWVSYRKEIRKPLKPASISAAMKDLAGYGSDQPAVVDRSIANGWQGLFPLNGSGKHSQAGGKVIGGINLSGANVL